MQQTYKKETDDPKEIERILLEANELSSLKSQVQTEDFASQLIQKIFHDDVNKALQLESLWKTRRKPVPLRFEEKYKTDLDKLAASPLSENLLINDTDVWSILEPCMYL